MLIKVSITRLTAVFLVSLIATLVQGAANGAASLGAFGNPYHAVFSEQGPVAHYRAEWPGEPLRAANIYVDDGFHLGLLPGGYTVFCLAPGEHGISPVLQGTHTYVGKHAQPRLQFEGRKAQFLRVSTYVHQLAQIVDHKLEEEELAEHRLQTHVLSRASAGWRACATAAEKELLATLPAGTQLCCRSSVRALAF